MSMPPQTPMGAPSRSVLQTPHKTPLRTPLRTPGEQMSHTPVISFAAIEAHKENVQPLVQGRSAHALNNALSQRQAELKVQRVEFEELVQSSENADSDDPLEAWTRYVKWCIDSYPSGQTNESELLLVLERCTRLFRSMAQYQNDSRYLRMWILYARNVDCPSDIYNFLLANEIGTSLASLYEELAIVYEGQSNFDKSDETYRLGIHRSAQPIDRLKRRYAEFQTRILSQDGRPETNRQSYKEALASAMTKAQRSMLGTKAGAISMSANTVRGLGAEAGLPKVPALSHNNARKPAVFKDADGDDVFARSKGAGNAGWADVGTAASRKQEKVAEVKPWKGEVLPQRDGGATPKRPAIAIYRDSDEEDDESGRTPGKAKAGDVFSKPRDPSEMDRLRRNPFANYDEAETQAKHAKQKQQGSASGPAASMKNKKPAQPSSKASASSQKLEAYAVPIRLLYPGLDIEQAVKRTSRKQKSGEICMEELLAQRYLPSSDEADPWAHLDAQHGRWLPEIRPSKSRAIKRDPTVTAFTRAAQDEVLQMFNAGLVNSDDESSDEQSDSEEEDDDVSGSGRKAMMKENDAIPPTPTPAPRSVSVPQRHGLGELAILGSSSQLPTVNEDQNGSCTSEAVKCNTPATPMRLPFGGDRKPLGIKAALPTSVEQAQRPQRIVGETFAEEEDEDSEEENQVADDRDHNPLDYLNMPMRELAPLSPITEATECTRFTQSTRTPATSMRQASQGWTPSAESEQRSYDESAYGDSLPHSERASLPRLSQHEFMQTHHSPDQKAESSDLQAQEAVTRDVDMHDAPARRNLDPICPVDAEVVRSILNRLTLPLESSADYVDLTDQSSNELPGLQKRAAQASKRRSSGHSSSLHAVDKDWTMRVGDHDFAIRHKLGEGGYGAVFLAEDRTFVTGRQRLVGGINGDASFANIEAYDDDDDMDHDEPKLIAVKVETPPNRWEFYILGQLRARLTDKTRLSSIVCARKFFCFQNESFLMLEYVEKGTLLEIVNNAVNAGVASSSAMAAGGAVGGGAGMAASVGIDEVLAMFFVVEVIKVVEALHAVDLLHGDLKIDNCLLRLSESEDAWTHAYDRTGANGWAAKGITLIDFGRAIDLRQFSPEQRFVADWTPERHDMPQIHKGQPWRYEIDYYGIASIAYCLLFGKYIDIVGQASVDVEGGERYAIDKPLRRYWQVDIWNALFSLCLNVGHDQCAPQQLADVRMRMEAWLEENCFRAGKNLKGSLKKLELWSMKRTM